jgi:transcriptional regulator with XRE-family HTH domain
VTSRPKRKRETDAGLGERIRSILAHKSLTLYQVSRESEALYGRSSPHFLPHTLYYGLRGGVSRPSVYQILALSRISGYALYDWLRVFGFNLEDIPRTQILVHSKRTKLVDSSLTDGGDWISWVRNRSGHVDVPPVAPLARLLEPSSPLRIRALEETSRSGFLFARIGAEDALAFPDLVPGSIVRVNRERPPGFASGQGHALLNRIYLVEHSKGLFCCRLRFVDENTIVPLSTLLSYAPVELPCPDKAEVLGVVDLEIRPSINIEQPKVPKDLARYWKPRPLATEENLGRLLRRARANANLSFRESAKMSSRIAELLGEDKYSVSPSSLCDYEAANGPPRDFHKAMTLCSIYGLPFHEFLKASGVRAEEAGKEPMPDHFVQRIHPADFVEDASHQGQTAPTGFLERLLELVGSVPFFLRHAAQEFSGMPHLSLGDFFWIGGETNVLHPYLARGLLALVNRRRRIPFYLASKPLWQQPLYVILTHDGKYLCACCDVENGSLVVHPYPQHSLRQVLFRNRQEAEVMGQIVTIVRTVV